MSRRDDILAAVYKASRMHAEFNSQVRVSSGEGRVDVFRMLVDRDIPTIFRPLTNLLGAFIDNPARGVIVTSRRQLPVQRFTAAHEFGHAVLGHSASFDDQDVLTRGLFEADRYDPREVQANAFASELLTPSWLIVEHMRRQGWTRDQLKDPVVVYQLSLRMGSSYAATCYALAESRGIDRFTCSTLLEIKPRSIKQSLVRGFQPASWHGDIWLVTERDHGMVLEGSRSDLVILNFKEHPSAGYVWQFGDLTRAGLAIRNDDRYSESREAVGGVVFRTVIAEPEHEQGARGHVLLKEVRPWQAQGTPLHSMELGVELSGPLSTGLHPAQRDALLGVA